MTKSSVTVSPAYLKSFQNRMSGWNIKYIVDVTLAGELPGRIIKSIAAQHCQSEFLQGSVYRIAGKRASRHQVMTIDTTKHKRGNPHQPPPCNCLNNHLSSKDTDLQMKFGSSDPLDKVTEFVRQRVPKVKYSKFWFHSVSWLCLAFPHCANPAGLPFRVLWIATISQVLPCLPVRLAGGSSVLTGPLSVCHQTSRSQRKAISCFW